MKFRLRSICALSLYIPTLAFASIQPTVVVGPVAAPPPPAEAVPTLESGLVVALGLLLAVIALRFLRQRPAYQKFLCLAVLGGGTLVTAWGVDRGVAAMYPTVIVPPEDAVCSSDEDEKTYNVDFFSASDITNNCESTSLEILRYEEFQYCGVEVTGAMVSTNGGVGTIIEPGATVQSDYCSPPT